MTPSSFDGLSAVPCGSKVARTDSRASRLRSAAGPLSQPNRLPPPSRCMRPESAPIEATPIESDAQ
eukprot:1418660-Prymnesium_polylepis.1